MPNTGVFPVFDNNFKIGINGRSGAASDMVVIKEMDEFSVLLDGNVEEWTPMDAEGWTNRLMTGKGFSISMSGKRYIGDPGNDYVAACAWKTGRDCDSKFEWEFPSGAKLAFDCIVNVTAPGGGSSTDVDTLEFEVLSCGKPTYTPAALPASK